MQSPVVTERILYLDGLRGVAATIVYLNHFAAAFFPAVIFGRQAMLHAGWEKAFYATPLGILTNGSFAVFLFIALSAFVMLRKVYQKPTSLRLMAVVGRYVRLMLPIAASTLIAFILLRLSAGAHVTAAALSHSPWLVGQWPAVSSLWEALRQGLWDAMWVNGSTYNSSLWMLHFIWYGSLVTFGISAFVRWPRVRVAIYLIGLMLTLSTPFSGFWIGALVYHFHERLQVAVKRFHNVDTIGVTLLILGVVLGSVPIILGDIPNVYWYILRPNLIPPFMYNVPHAFAAGFVLVAVCISPMLQNVFSAKTLVALGRVGFATYLLHVLLISSLASWLLVHLVGLPYLLAVGWTFLTTTIVLAVTAVLFHRFVEKPTERFSRRLASL